MTEKNRGYNVYNNYYGGNIDTGNAAPAFMPEDSEDSATTSQKIRNFVTKNISVVITVIIVAACLVLSTVSYSKTVESNQELNSVTSELEDRHITLNAKKSTYEEILRNYDIDDEAAKLHMVKPDDTIEVILSEATE